MHNSVDAIEASAAADADELHDLTGDDVGLIQQISSNSHDVQCDVQLAYLSTDSQIFVVADYYDIDQTFCAF